MKKLICILLIASALALTACSANRGSAVSVSNTKDKVLAADINSAAAAITDSTVKFDKIFDVSGKSVVMQGESFNGADYAEKPAIEVADLKQKAGSIVKGTIQKVEYTEYNKRPLTILSVLVTESYKGEVKANTLLSVIKSGGCMTLKAFVDGREGKFTIVDDSKENLSRFEISRSDYENGVMQVKSANDSITEVGDKDIFYLDRIDNQDVLTGCYRPTGGSGVGIFSLDGDTATRYVDPGTEIADAQKEQAGYSVKELVSVS